MIPVLTGSRSSSTQPKMSFIEPEGVVGDHYAIHQRLRHGRPTGPGWTVTHIPSGLAVWTVDEFDAAVRVARWLDEHQALPVPPAPANLDAMWKWYDEDEQRVMQLIFSLTDVAPRAATLDPDLPDEDAARA